NGIEAKGIEDRTFKFTRFWRKLFHCYIFKRGVMKKVYINSIVSISPQKTFDNSDFLNEITYYNDTVIYAQDPDYKQFIPPAAARRMAKGIKMGVVASKIAMDEAGIETVDAIITGTGMGGMSDSEN